MKTNKKQKREKLDSIPKINRRLFKLWSDCVRGRASFSCEYCGAQRGEINSNGKPVKIDAHHLMNRDVTDCPLKFDIRNGVSVCSKCHKFSPDNSFHLNPVVTMHWLKNNRPERFEFVLQNFKERIDLHNRDILMEIENHLIKKEPLDIEKLKIIDKIAKDKKASENKNIFDALGGTQSESLTI